MEEDFTLKEAEKIIGNLKAILNKLGGDDKGVIKKLTDIFNTIEEKEKNIKNDGKKTEKVNISIYLLCFIPIILFSFTLYQNYQLSQKNSILESKIETNLNLNENLKMNREVHISNNPPSNKQAIWKNIKNNSIWIYSDKYKTWVERY